MKKNLLLGAAICCMFTLGSCKPKSSAYKTAYDQAKTADTDWDDDDEDDSEVLTTEEVSYESVRTESVKPVQNEDVSGLKKYSVVIGAFDNRTNAFSLKERMVKDGYKPIIAENDFGQYRVIIASFDVKADAVRARDAFKSKYAPNFKDAWILDRK